MSKLIDETEDSDICCAHGELTALALICHDIVGRLMVSWIREVIRQTRTEKLDLRLTPDAKRILATAAAAERRSITDFVLDSALDRAEERLADRKTFHLDAEKWQAFLAALDAPTRDLPRMRKLLSEPSIFLATSPRDQLPRREAVAPPRS